MTRPLHLSASCIADYKACPVRFRNAYVLGIRPAEDTESQRVGSNWHRILDIASRKPGSVCTHCAKLSQNDSNCAICGGTGFLPDDIMEAVVRELNKIYAGKEVYDKEAMELERIKLLYSLCGYRWRWEDRPDTAVLREEHFSLPLINPSTGRALPNVKLVGCIDKFIEWGDRLAIAEHKSTSKSLDSDSTYWGHLNLDTQTTLYLYVARRLQQEGLLGLKKEYPLINTIIYDVWHKPTINPKKLTQADSTEFVKTGDYFGQKFEVIWGLDNGELPAINGVGAQIEPGKKEGTFAITETPEMYGARLLQDITERPDFYFQYKEITKTDKEIQEFEYELLNIYRTMQNMIKTGHFYKNEHQCEATFKCSYIEQCYNNIEMSVDNIPNGMKLIFEGEQDDNKNTTAATTEKE